MKPIRPLVMAMTALWLAGCQVWAVISMSGELKETVFAPSIPFRTVLLENSLFQDNREERALFNSQADADTFMANHPTVYSDAQNNRTGAIPPIDFIKEQGIMLVSNRRPYPAVLEVMAVEDQQERRYVRTVLWEYRPEDFKPAMMSQPVHYIAIPRSEKAIVFAPIVQAFYDQRPPQARPIPESSPYAFVPLAPRPSVSPDVP